MTSITLKQLASDLRSSVFGPGTDLYSTFSENDVISALQCVTQQAGKTCPLLELYGFTEGSITELISMIAVADAQSLRSIAASQERRTLATELERKTGGFLLSFPEAYSDFCPKEFRDVRKSGLQALVLRISRKHGSDAVSRSFTVEQDNPDLKESSPVLPGDSDKTVKIIVRRGLSEEQAALYLARAVSPHEVTSPCFPCDESPDLVER